MSAEPSGRAAPHGLPDHLPDGERLLWQGAPDWRLLALRAFRVRALALYFAGVIALRVLLAVTGGTPLRDVAQSALLLALVALAPLAFLAAFAWLTGRATVYTITSKRVVIRLGIALPMTINLPFGKIDAAAFKARADGSGDISLLLNAGDRLAYLALWPHARPWRLSRAEPTLRAVPDVGRVGQILARALAASAALPAPTVPDAQPEHAAGGSQAPLAA